jgi:hypothetical protein
MENKIKAIRDKRENLKEIWGNILESNNSIENKIIDAVYYLPSQSYGRCIKNIICDVFNGVESSHSDMYLEDYGDVFVKVCVTKNDYITLKQVSVFDQVQHYISVYLNYYTEEVIIFIIPKNTVLSFIADCPDHGNALKGITQEYTAKIPIELIKEYIFEEGIR